jgi:hypothetical protein
MGQDDQVGKGENPEMTPADNEFRKLLDEDIATEARLLWSEIAILAFVTLLVCSYLILID